MRPISSKISVNIEGKRKQKKYKKAKKEDKRRKSKGCTLGCYIGCIREYALGGNVLKKYSWISLLHFVMLGVVLKCKLSSK